MPEKVNPSRLGSGEVSPESDHRDFSPAAPTFSMEEIKRATFERDLKECFEHLKSLAHVYELRRQNPRWRII